MPAYRLHVTTRNFRRTVATLDEQVGAYLLARPSAFSWMPPQARLTNWAQTTVDRLHVDDVAANGLSRCLLREALRDIVRLDLITAHDLPSLR